MVRLWGANGRCLPISLSLPPAGSRGDDGFTLRHLIEHVVRAEVAAFQQRQRDRLDLRVLTARDIDEGLEKGKVESGA